MDGRPPPARLPVGLVLAARRGRHRSAECHRVRVELGEVAEGLMELTTSTRRHVRRCERCALFNNQLDANNRALAAIFRAGSAPGAPAPLAPRDEAAHSKEAR